MLHPRLAEARLAQPLLAIRTGVVKAAGRLDEPLMTRLGLTPRVAEVLLWIAQGKTNAEIATILGNSESTVKKQVLGIFEKLGVETRTAASLRAMEVLGSGKK